MSVVFDQVEGRVMGDGPARQQGDESKQKSAVRAAGAEDLLRELERSQRLAERLRAD